MEPCVRNNWLLSMHPASDRRLDSPGRPIGTAESPSFPSPCALSDLINDIATWVQSLHIEFHPFLLSTTPNIIQESSRYWHWAIRSISTFFFEDNHCGNVPFQIHIWLSFKPNECETDVVVKYLPLKSSFLGNELAIIQSWNLVDLHILQSRRCFWPAAAAYLHRRASPRSPLFRQYPLDATLNQLSKNQSICFENHHNS